MIRRTLIAAALLGALPLAGTTPASAQGDVSVSRCNNALQVNAIWRNWDGSGRVTGWTGSFTNMSPNPLRANFSFNYGYMSIERLENSLQTFNPWETKQIVLARTQPIPSDTINLPDTRPPMFIQCLSGG